MSFVTTTMVCLHHHGVGHDKHYNIYVEYLRRSANTQDSPIETWEVWCTYGKAAEGYISASTLKFSAETLAQAQTTVRHLIDEKERKGYVNVLAANYSGHKTWNELQAKSHPRNACTFQYYFPNAGAVAFSDTRPVGYASKAQKAKGLGKAD